MIGPDIEPTLKPSVLVSNVMCEKEHVRGFESVIINHEKMLFESFSYLMRFSGQQHKG
jgi:hypothetical protein